MNNSKLCLLIEDDPDDQEFFIDTLHAVSADTGCYAVSNGQEALNALIQEQLTPDYIFTDLEMPVMDGFEFLKHLRSMERYRTTPVIIYTGSYSEDHIQKAQSFNVTAIYSKFRMNALKGILRKYFTGTPERRSIL